MLTLLLPFYEQPRPHVHAKSTQFISSGYSQQDILFMQTAINFCLDFMALCCMLHNMEFNTHL
jgi:hypothetical protein